MGSTQTEEVAAAPVYDAPRLLDDPHLKARKTYEPVDDPDLGRIRMQAPVPRLSHTPAVIDHTGRGLGEDNAYVYGEILALPEEEIERLRSENVI